MILRYKNIIKKKINKNIFWNVWIFKVQQNKEEKYILDDDKNDQYIIKIILKRFRNLGGSKRNFVFMNISLNLENMYVSCVF